MKNIEKRKSIAWILAVVLVFATCQPSVFADMLPAENGVEQIDLAEVPDSAQAETEAPEVDEVGVDLSEDSLEGEYEEEFLVGASCQDLMDYITDVTIAGADVDPATGAYTVVAGQEYEIILHFEETEALQFPEENLTMTYPLPQGVSADSQNDVLDIVVTASDHPEYTVCNNAYSIDAGTNLITYIWNNNDPNWSKLTQATNAEFGIKFKGKFDGSAYEIDFGNGIIKYVEVDDTHDVKVSKDGYMDMDNKTAVFTITVTSIGMNNNVVISDSMAGSALKYVGDAAFQGNSSTPEPVSSDDNGFVFALPSMNNNETVRITYSAELDSSRLNAAEDHGILTAEETNNTVTVSSDEDSEEESASKSFPGSRYMNMKKEAAVDENGSTVTWTIRLNEERIGSAAGTTITDSINEDSRDITTYSGDGITITRIDDSGETSETVGWDSVSMTGDGDYDWSYTIPESYGNVSYVITYTTESDTSGELKERKIGNTAKNDAFELIISSSASVKPMGTELSIDKSVVTSNTQETTWKLNVTLPKGRDYQSVEITDDYPKTSRWDNGAELKYIDELVGDSVSVEGVTDIDYPLIRNEEGRLVIEFFRDPEYMIPGLDATDEDRNIVVTLTTAVDQNWLNDAADGKIGKEHWNNAAVKADGVEDMDSDKVMPLKATVTKKCTAQSMENVDGVDYPCYKYEVIISSVSEDTITIEDSFDPDILKVYEGKPYDYQDRYVFGGGQYSQDIRGYEQASFTPTDTGAAFTVNVPKDDTEYYPYYKFVYYLIIKDQDAVSILTQRAAENGGKTTIGNTASYGGISSEQVNVEYIYEPEASATLSVTKAVNGLYEGDETFEFKLAKVDETTNDVIVNDTAEAENGATATFEAIMYTEEGDYYYSITEQSGDTTGMFYDTAAKYAYVHIERKDGKLTATSIRYGDSIKEAEGSLLDRLIEFFTGGQESLTVTNTFSVVRISKTDLDTSGELKGAVLTVTQKKDAGGADVNPDDAYTTTWTSDGEAAHEIYGLEDGTYELTEDQAPLGYDTAEKITFVIKDGIVTGTDDNTIVMSDKQNKTDIKISKIDTTNGEVELAGAELTVTMIKNVAGEEVSNVIESWTSDGTVHEIDGLTDGTYTLVEMSAPSGYKVAEPITFVIKDGELVEDENSANGVVTMHDELYRTDVQISKVDAGEGNELAGAELTVKRIVNIEGEEVSDEIESWTSEGTVHEIDGLTDGTYTLVEISAPSGYKAAEPITFVIKDGKLVEDDNASEGVVTMKDVKTKVQVSKVDIADGEELEGATIQILDKDGGVACEWTSTKEPHVIEGLKTNEEYTLKETVAPSGYTLAGETTFTIDESGKVTSTGTISGEGVLLVEDQKTSITVSIADKEGKAIEGVKIQILDEKGNVVAEWRSDTDSHTIEGLNPGEYTLKVVTGLDGYEDAAPITLTLEADGTVKVNGEEAEVIMMTTEKITVPPKPTYRFSDVTDPEHAYFNAIYWAADKGITKGYPDGTFGINRSCTRGEMMMFLWRYAGKPAPKWSSKSPFKDVKKDHVFYRAILWGFQKGITKGYSDGTFGIDRSVSRGEAMMFLWRLKGKPAPKAAAKSPFKDVPKTHVFYKAILWAYQKKVATGYTSGKNKGKYMINEYCSRGQVVTFLYRVK